MPSVLGSIRDSLIGRIEGIGRPEVHPGGSCPIGWQPSVFTPVFHGSENSPSSFASRPGGRNGSQGFGHVVKMPEFDPDMESYANGVFKLEVLREVPEQKHSREWLSDKARAELEVWEREQAELFAED